MAAPTIITQPGDDFVDPVATNVIILGESFSFRVEVADPTGVTYQWRKNGVNLSGATSDIYDKTPSVGADAGAYSVACTLAGTVVSSNAYLTILYPPVITNQPHSNAVVAGSNVHFSVRVDATKLPNDFTYQWQVDGFDLANDGVSVAGSQTTDLWLTNVNAADTGNYVCFVQNSVPDPYGTVSTTGAVLNVVVPPSIADQPDPLSVLVGDLATFILFPDPSTTDTDDFPLTYQWRKGGTTILGESNNLITVGPVTVNDALDYTCVLKNWAGALTSAVAHLTVNVPLTITTQPQGGVVAFSGSPYTLSVVASGTAPIVYQWRSNLLDILNATNSTFSFIPSTTNQSAIYDCVLSNVVGTVDSDDAIVIVRSEITPPNCSFYRPSGTESRWTNSSIGVTNQVSDGTGGSGVATVRCRNFTINGPWVPCLTNATTGATRFASSNNLTLIPGTNILHAEADDVAGNTSVTAVYTIFYPVPVPFTLLMAGNGFGVINTDTNFPAPYQKTALSNGLTLEYGRTYYMTSAPTSGSRFVTWIGDVTSTSSNLAFVSQSNGVITALFGETNRPTLAITNPAASGRFTNFGNFTLIGTATDTTKVASVQWQLNTNAWVAATGTNPWSALTAPLVGSNIFRAFAVDTSSNYSTTNTLVFTNVTIAILNLLTNGQGTVSNSLAGQTLLVSSNYTMRATAATNNGFAFTNWTGTTNGTFTLQTNGATLNFTMKSNLTLQVNFPDVQNPTLAITNPLPPGVITNPAFTARGTASDNDRVVAVNYQLNTAAWAVATGTNNWLANLTLASGTNTLRAYAVDAWGNRSTTNTLTAVNPLLTPVTVTLMLTNNTVRAAFSTVVGATYYLEGTALSGPSVTWSNVASAAAGNGGALILTDTAPPATNRFYRVRAIAP
ncbi:MAG: hypothetical protein RL380_888 [Verrucomicrobiota bacterium]